MGCWCSFTIPYIPLEMECERMRCIAPRGAVTGGNIASLCISLHPDMESIQNIPESPVATALRMRLLFCWPGSRQVSCSTNSWRTLKWKPRATKLSSPSLLVYKYMV